MSIRLLSLHHRFGRQRALAGVSIHLRRGDCYGLVGHNGAGKTTALRIAVGLLAPQRGRVTVDGFDARQHPREARMLVGAMIETPVFYRRASGRTNLVLLGRLQGLSGADARREADRVLDIVGLRPEATKRFGAYSQGMKQRLGLAQALMGNPPYLLLDEPTNGLDPEGVADIRSLLRRLVHDDGRTVLISSHQLQELSGLCNRIGLLKEGRMLVEETMEELLAEKRQRYEVCTDDDDTAAAALAGLGLSVEREEGLRFDLAGRDPGDVARALVETKLSLRAFAPRPPELEEVYLHWARTGTPPGDPEPLREDATESSTPARRAPTWPSLRMLSHELRRARGLGLLMLLPALVAVAAIRSQHVRAEATAQEAAEQGIISTTSVTAFQSAGGALDAAIPLLVLLVAGVASQSIAGERSRGTLRHLLLRPARRIQLAAGKASAVMALTLAAYSALAAATLLASGRVFDYSDLTELLLTGEIYPIETATAQEMWPRLWRALAAPMLPLGAYAGIGFLAGAVMRGAAGALAVALSAVAVLDLLRVAARGYGIDAWLPASHLPSRLGDPSSYIHYYIDAARGASDAVFLYGSKTIVLPCLWIVATFSLAGLVTAMRSEQ
ncbi:MAG: ATP-binding cassette domain-containing protein [Planctomycetota bacterium]